MSVKLEGIKKLRANYYNKIIINQDQAYGNYSVSIKGEPIRYDTERVGERFGKTFSTKSDDDQIREIMEDYIDHTKICGYTDLIYLQGYGSDKRFNVVYGNFGYREMILRLFNQNFSDIFRKIQQKYYQDRFDFCYDEKGIKTFKISTNNCSSSYGIDYDKINPASQECEFFKHIKLRTNNYILTDAERNFISQFVINIFSKFGEEIEVEKVYYAEYSYLQSKVIGYILKCGDVKMYIEKQDTLLPIIIDVANYNTRLKKEKEKCMKRQLKMEGI